MRHFAVAVSMIVSWLVLAGIARADVSGLRLEPPSVAAGQSSLATVTLSEPAPAGGQEVILQAYGPFAGYPSQGTLVKVAQGQTSVSHPLLLPAGLERDERYTIQAYIVGRPAFRNVELTVRGTEPGDFRVVSFTGPSTLRVGKPAEPVLTLNRPAPAGGLLVERQYVGASTPEVRSSERLLVPAGSVRGTTEAFAPEYEFQGERPSRLQFRIGASVGSWETTMIDDRPRDDTRWPQTRILSGPPADTPVSGPISFTFEADEPAATFECQLARGGQELGAPEPCSSPKTYSALEGGGPEYSFRVRATDRAGNTAPLGGSRSFAVAEPGLPGPKPPAPAIAEPIGFRWLDVGNVTLRGTSVPGATIEVSDSVIFGLPARYWRTYASPSGQWTLRVSQLTEGIHRLNVRASNRSGSSPSSIAQVQVDTLTPAAPTLAAARSDGAVVLEGKAEPGNMIELYEQGEMVGSVRANTGRWTKTMSGGTRFAARAVDYAGNRSAMSDAVDVAADPPSYTYVPIGAFGTSVYAGSEGRAVNNAGQVAGFGNGNNPGSLLAMRWQNGVMTNLGGVHLGGVSAANAINEAGITTGYMHVDQYTPPKAFVSRDGRPVRLDDGLGRGRGQPRARDQRRRRCRRRPQRRAERAAHGGALARRAAERAPGAGRGRRSLRRDQRRQRHQQPRADRRHRQAALGPEPCRALGQRGRP